MLEASTLLTQQECDTLQRFLALPSDPQLLLLRLYLRQRPCISLDTLPHYPEIVDTPTAAELLLSAALVVQLPDPLTGAGLGVLSAAKLRDIAAVVAATVRARGGGSAPKHISQPARFASKKDVIAYMLAVKEYYERGGSAWQSCAALFGVAYHGVHQGGAVKAELDP